MSSSAVDASSPRIIPLAESSTPKLKQATSSSTPSTAQNTSSFGPDVAATTGRIGGSFGVNGLRAAQAPRKRFDPQRLTDKIANKDLRKATAYIVAEVFRSGVMLASHTAVSASAVYLTPVVAALVGAYGFEYLINSVVTSQMGPQWCSSAGTAVAAGILFALPLPGPLRWLSPCLNFNAKQAALFNIGFATGVAALGTLLAKLGRTSVDKSACIIAPVWLTCHLATLVGLFSPTSSLGSRLLMSAPARQYFAAGCGLIFFQGDVRRYVIGPERGVTKFTGPKLTPNQKTEAFLVGGTRGMLGSVLPLRIWRGN